jgi:hypothetical protein
MNESELIRVGARVSAAVDAVENAHPDMCSDTIRELVSVREWMVGMECLFDNLHEEEICLAADLYLELVELGKLLGIESRYWEGLKSYSSRCA